MEIKEFLERLRELAQKTAIQTGKLENNGQNGMETMAELVKMIEILLPDWFFFIEKTEIGKKENILFMLEDMQKGILAEDRVYLADTLWNGLRTLTMEYIEIIEEALDGESYLEE